MDSNLVMSTNENVEEFSKISCQYPWAFRNVPLFESIPFGHLVMSGVLNYIHALHSLTAYAYIFEHHQPPIHLWKMGRNMTARPSSWRCTPSNGTDRTRVMANLRWLYLLNEWEAKERDRERLNLWEKTINESNNERENRFLVDFSFLAHKKWGE